MAEQSNPGTKAILIGVAFGLVGLGLGAYTMTSSKLPPVDTSIERSNDKSSLSQPALQELASVTSAREVQDAALEGRERKSSLLFSPEFWQVSDPVNKKNTVIDIQDPKAKPIHFAADGSWSIPNSWFLENKLDYELSLKNGAELDTDGDGFSNLEEFLAQTNPQDANAYPTLISPENPKMRVKQVRSNSAILTVDGALAFEANEPAETRISIYPRVGETKESKRFDKVKVGDYFNLGFGDEKRFQLVGFVKHSFTDSVGYATEEMCIKVKDNDPYTAEKEFILRPGRPVRSSKEIDPRIQKGRRFNEKNVTFVMIAGSAKGKEEATFTVPVGAVFNVPGEFSDPQKSKAVQCKLISVNEKNDAGDARREGTANIKPLDQESEICIQKL